VCVPNGAGMSATEHAAPRPLTLEERVARRQQPRSVWQTRAGRVLAFAAVVLLAATVAGLVLLWPQGPAPHVPAAALAGSTTGATVVSRATPDCGGPTRQRCLRIGARIDDGRAKGRVVSLLVGPVDFAPSVHTGDTVRVESAGGSYGFAGLDRRTPLLWLAVVVAVAAVLLVRWRGVLAIAGLAVSLLLVTHFVLPAILAGRPALLVALVGALAVSFVTLVLTSGIGAQSLTAMIGIAATLLLAAVAGLVIAHVDQLDGRSTDAANALVQAGSHISLQGVVVAGVVLGALGALTDTAVTQASAVMALRRTDPTLSVRRLYAEAFSVGRDHLSATVHTLVLAYVGATLPFLLALHATHTPLADALSGEQLAEPIAATLVGALALLLCVPVTTALAAMLASRLPTSAVPHGHGHAH
jgi:uncharacterized membrane protein